MNCATVAATPWVKSSLLSQIISSTKFLFTCRKFKSSLKLHYTVTCRKLVMSFDLYHSTCQSLFLCLLFFLISRWSHTCPWDVSLYRIIHNAQDQRSLNICHWRTRKPRLQWLLLYSQILIIRLMINIYILINKFLFWGFRSVTTYT